MKATYWIILVCLVIFLYAGTLSHVSRETFFENFAFYPSFGSLLSKPWTPVTSIFLHSGPEHLILNMIALFFFGHALEEEIPRKKFLLIFFLGGIFGNLISMFFYTEPLIGASGAVFAVMGAAMLIKPFEFILFPSILPIPLLLVGILFTVSNVLAFLFGPETNIAYLAHIGGLLVGLFFGIREEGRKSGFVILIIFLLLLITPFIWNLLTATDYTGFIQKIF